MAFKQLDLPMPERGMNFGVAEGKSSMREIPNEVI